MIFFHVCSKPQPLLWIKLICNTVLLTCASLHAKWEILKLLSMGAAKQLELQQVDTEKTVLTQDCLKLNMRDLPYVYATWTHTTPSLLNQSLLFRLWPLPSLGLSLSISAYNRPRSTGFYILGLASRFRVFLTAGPLLADQGLPSGHGSRCLFNFCPQHFKIISQDLDWSQENSIQ